MKIIIKELTTEVVANINAFISKKKEAEGFSLELKALKSIRSSEQNRFFHGAVLDAFSRTTGYYKEEAKVLLKKLYMNELGTKDWIDTHKLDLTEMRLFIDFCIKKIEQIGGYLTTVEYEEYIRLKGE